jgi:hypothetical protein
MSPQEKIATRIAAARHLANKADEFQETSDRLLTTKETAKLIGWQLAR